MGQEWITTVFYTPTTAVPVLLLCQLQLPTQRRYLVTLVLTTADHLPAAALAASCTDGSTSVACAASAAATSPHQPWMRLHSMPLVTLLASNASSSACKRAGIMPTHIYHCCLIRYAFTHRMHDMND